MSAGVTHTPSMSAWGAIRLSAGIVLVTLGSLLMAIAVPAAISAATIEASVGRSGVVTQPLGTLRSAPSDTAVVVDGVSARLVAPDAPEWAAGALALAGTDVGSLAADLGEVVLVATPAEGEAFVGVAPVEEVNAYLDGTAYSVAVRESGEWPTVSVPGIGAPAPPQGEGIWVAAASGAAPELPAGTLEGLTLVLMRTDATAGPEAALRLEYRLPGADVALQSAAVLAAAGSVGGFLFILLGGWLVVGRRRRPQ